MSEPLVPYHANYPAVVNPPVVPWTGTAELIAWRAWRLGFILQDDQGDCGPRLLSLAAPRVWSGPAARAELSPTISTAPPTGIYALKMTSAERWQWRNSEFCWVTGLVALSGRVVEHALGYRAERAVIRELRLGVGIHLAIRKPKMLSDIMDRLEERYDAPVDPGCWERTLAERMRVHDPKPEWERLAVMPTLRPPWKQI